MLGCWVVCVYMRHRKNEISFLHKPLITQYVFVMLDVCVIWRWYLWTETCKKFPIYYLLTYLLHGEEPFL